MAPAGAPSAPTTRSRRTINSYVPRGEPVRRGGGWEAAVLTLTMISLEELLGQLLKMVFCSPLLVIIAIIDSGYSIGGTRGESTGSWCR
jgi:hypothetical protein